MPVKTQIAIGSRQEELKEHGSYGFPVLISDEALSRFYSGSFLWHWHPEIELTLFTEGTMIYQINDRIFCPKAGDALFGNSNTLHTGRMKNGEDCRYISVTFHPRLIYGFEGSAIQSRYVEPITDSGSLCAVFFDGSEAWHEKAVELLKTVIQTGREREPGYEMEVLGRLISFWSLLYEQKAGALAPEERAGKSQERIRRILSYIHANYQSPITLEDISRQIHLCKGECCRLFKGYMNESLFEYLLKYRIEKSLPAVLEGRGTMTEIALNSGFTDPNYFTKVFHKVKGCSPREYRKQRVNL